MIARDQSLLCASFSISTQHALDAAPVLGAWALRTSAPAHAAADLAGPDLLLQAALRREEDDGQGRALAHAWTPPGTCSHGRGGPGSKTVVPRGCCIDEPSDDPRFDHEVMSGPRYNDDCANSMRLTIRTRHRDDNYKPAS